MRDQRIQGDLSRSQHINCLLRAVHLPSYVDNRNFLPPQFMYGDRDCVGFWNPDKNEFSPGLQQIDSLTYRRLITAAFVHHVQEKGVDPRNRLDDVQPVGISAPGRV